MDDREADVPVTSGADAAKIEVEGGRPAEADLQRSMAAYQAGSLEAFTEVYARLAPPIGRYLRYLARRADVADDLLQETFLQMHRARASYNPAFPVTPWAFGLARHVFLMQRRASARFAAVHDVTDAPPELPVPAEFERWAAADEIKRAMTVLDRDQIEALVLHHVWGFTFDEIAGLVGISSAAARARSSRAMAAIRQAIIDRRQE